MDFIRHVTNRGPSPVSMGAKVTTKRKNVVNKPLFQQLVVLRFEINTYTDL